MTLDVSVEKLSTKRIKFNQSKSPEIAMIGR